VVWNGFFGQYGRVLRRGEMRDNHIEISLTSRDYKNLPNDLPIVTGDCEFPLSFSLQVSSATYGIIASEQEEKIETYLQQNF
jgi:hypothetical protein